MAGISPELRQEGEGRFRLGRVTRSIARATAQIIIAGHPSVMKSRNVADSECQLPATARPRTRPNAKRNPPSLMPDAKSRSSAMETEALPPISSVTQSTSKPAVPRPAEKKLFKYEGPSPRLPPI